MVDSYLQNPSLVGPHPTSLEELYKSGDFLVLPYQQESIKQALISSTANTTYKETKARISSLRKTLTDTLNTNNLTALIYPEQQNLVVKIGSQSQHGRNGILAAVTGFPVITVPAGFSAGGVPIGMEILGYQWSERELIGIGKGIEELGVIRRMPEFANASVEVRVFEEVPVVGPDRGNIPDVYKVGVL